MQFGNRRVTAFCKWVGFGGMRLLVAVNGIIRHKCLRHENVKPSLIMKSQAAIWTSLFIYIWLWEFSDVLSCWSVEPVWVSIPENQETNGLNVWLLKNPQKTWGRRSLIWVLQNPFKEQSKIKSFTFFDFVKSSVNKNGLSFLHSLYLMTVGDIWFLNSRIS